MEKEQFLSLVRNYTALTADEAGLLAGALKDFPYSQILHNLAARASQDNGLGSKEKLLHISAIYTTDRSVLKSIMTAPGGERHREMRPPVRPVVTREVSVVPVAPVTTEKENVKEAVVNADEPISESVTPPGENDTTPERQAGIPSTGFIPSDLSDDALRTDIMAELKKLQKAKQKFDGVVEAYDKENADGLKSAKRHAKKTDDVADTIIEEIKTAKKKVQPEGKQKEQIEIIENFIKTKPSITKPKATPPPPGSDDLAEKSLMYGNNIVSETLVEILLKQGKKDKAVEVLKKLIWKFPQKKAYFAARIEELKK